MDATTDAAVDTAPAGDGEELLSDEEKSALLAGVEAGVVGADDSGDAPVSVTPFELRPDAYINFGSYPRLQGICQQMAKRLARQWSAMLRTRVQVSAEETFSTGFASAVARERSPLITLRIGLAPLPHHALLLFGDSLLTLLVESFFGFTGEAPADDREDDVRAAEAPPRQSFTPGELRVVELAAEQFLAVIAPCWEKLVALTPALAGRDFDPTLGSGVEPKERVIVCHFEINAPGHTGTLRWLLPEKLVAPVIDDLEGAANARSVAGDPHWRRCIEHHLADIPVSSAVLVGDVSIPLRRLVALQAGDLLPLSAPEQARLAVAGVTRAVGGFGIADGRNAFRLTRWLPSDSAAAAHRAGDSS